MATIRPMRPPSAIDSRVTTIVTTTASARNRQRRRIGPKSIDGSPRKGGADVHQARRRPALGARLLPRLHDFELGRLQLRLVRLLDRSQPGEIDGLVLVDGKADRR